MASLSPWRIGLFSAYVLFLLVSFAAGISFGRDVALTFSDFARNMLLILPPAFLLIGLFEVWVDRDMVERGFGAESGAAGFLWALLLAATTTGGAYVAFPVAYTLYRKGAAYQTIFTYVGAAAILRIPMSIFEASFLGVKFTVVRFFASLPLVIASSILLGRYLDRVGYNLPELSEAKENQT